MAKAKKKKAAPAKKVAAKKNSKKAVKKAAKTSKKAQPAKKSAAKATAKTKIKATAKSPKKSKVAKKSAAKSVAKKTTKTLAKSASSVAQKHPREMLTPLDDRLVVKTSGVEKKTPGGLFIPDTVTESSANLQGIVAAVGRGHLSKKGKLRSMDVKPGDQVMFSPYAGSKVQFNGEDFVILRETDILGVIQK